MFQQIYFRLINGNKKIIPDLKLPNKQEITNNIKATIPKVNNFLQQKQSILSNKKNTQETILPDTKLKNKSKYYKRAGITFIGSLTMFLLFDPMIQAGITKTFFNNLKFYFILVLDFNMQLKPNGLITKFAW